MDYELTDFREVIHQRSTRLVSLGDWLLFVQQVFVWHLVKIDADHQPSGLTGGINFARFMELERKGGPLTREELCAGWHFCNEFDEGLIQPEELGDDPDVCVCGFDRRKYVDTQRPTDAIQREPRGTDV